MLSPRVYLSIVSKPGVIQMPGLFLSWTLAILMVLVPSAQAAPADAWSTLREAFFAGKHVQEEAAPIRLDIAPTAENPALVPVTISTTRPGIKRLWLLVDGNPVPLTATLTLLREIPEFHFQTRIRLEKSTRVRVVAEDAQGLYFMTSAEVRTPGGGCGGGLDGDEAKLRAEAGRIRIRHEAPSAQAAAAGHWVFMIKHPMRTGFERTTQGYYAKPWFIRQLDIAQAGQPLMQIELGVGISADPWLSLPFIPTLPATLQLSASDNEGKVYQQQYPATPHTGDRP